MSLNTSDLFGIHESALKMHAMRSKKIATNLANKDVPNYKSTDFDWRQALKTRDEQDKISHQMSENQKKQLPSLDNIAQMNVMYRSAVNPSLDGNTVDEQIEQVEFSENSLRLMAQINVIDGKIRSLQQALRGHRG